MSFQKGKPIGSRRTLWLSSMLGTFLYAFGQMSVSKLDYFFRQILHNPDVYHEPERFMPDRYLVVNPPPDPESYAFGFGRRCLDILLFL